MSSYNLNSAFGDADLFLIDWVLKGNLPQKGRILDAGCGSGRNLLYFAQNNFDVHALDQNESEVRVTNFLLRSLGQPENGKTGDLASIPYPDQSFDFIICSRVLHFAESSSHLMTMFLELLRVCRTSGCIYLSMSSTIGFDRSVRINEDKVQFPNGDIRLPMTQPILERMSETVSHQADPRTVIFGEQHAETTLIVQPR